MFTKPKPKLTTQDIHELRQITIWGVGLIGGSLGLSLKKNGFQGNRIGLGRDIGRLENALQNGAVDVVTTDLTEAIKDSELIVLCPPVTLVPKFMSDIIGVLGKQKKRVVVTDVGSTKSVIVETVEKQINETEANGLSFVGGHPMAGSHETGVNASRSDLFENAHCILTPTENTDADAVELVKNLWEFIGLDTHLCSPEDHDLLIGAASHLPHLAASVLAKTVANVGTQDAEALDFTATGFRDSTRIAAGSAELWSGIFLQNREVLLSHIDMLVDNIIEFKTWLKKNDTKEMQKLLTEAQKIVLKLKKTD